MKRLTAALTLFFAIGAGVAAGQSGQNRAGLPFWEPVGPWVVLLLPLADGSYGCTALTRPGPARRYSVAFALSGSTTHFYLNDPALTGSAPSAVSLAVDGHFVAQLKVLLHESYGAGQKLLMADVPGATLARKVLPEMIGGRQLEVSAGDRHWAIPIADFAAVLRELQDCARIALTRQPRFSSETGRPGTRRHGRIGGGA